MIIVSVLKCGKDFGPKHTQWLHKQFGEHKSICLTDANHIKGVETTPLMFNWPGWWSKLELFNPDHPVLGKEDLLYFDIDTVITGDISDLFKARNFTMLREFNHPSRVNSSIMMIPASIKKEVWEKFTSNTDAIMHECTTAERWGDQGFLGSILTPDHWQDLIPGRIISYKCNIATRSMIGFNRKLASPFSTGSVPVNTSIVCFHGYPRPWKTGFKWVPRLSVMDYAYGKAKNVGLKLRISSIIRQFGTSPLI